MTRRLAFALLAAPLLAQQAPQRLTVPFSDPGRPGLVKAVMMTGSITVKGTDAKEVQIEMGSAKDDDESRRRPQRLPKKAEGLSRVEFAGGSGLNVEEDANTITIKNQGFGRSRDGLTVYVPRKTSLQLKTMAGGDLVVEDVDGAIEVTNMNGEVHIRNCAGSVLANSMNGDVTATLTRVDPTKPMSFVTMNGDVDVTLPADIKARVKMKSMSGEVYSDFDIRPDAAARPIVEEGGKGGKYRVKVDNAALGTINGGGSELTLQTYHGEIYIRRRK